MFAKNVGPADRLARLILGVVLIALVIFFHQWWAILAAVLGVILILTAAFSTCGLYTLFGINTCKKAKP